MKKASDLFDDQEVSWIKNVTARCDGQIIGVYDVAFGEGLMDAVRKLYPRKHPKFWTTDHTF